MKIKLAEVVLKNDALPGVHMRYLNTQVNGTKVEWMQMDYDRREIIIKMKGQKKFEIPYENVVYKRNADVSKKKAVKEPEKDVVEGLEEYPGE
jgi:hypothetical protein